MDTQLEFRRRETAAHARLKRLSVLWAQANGFTACATEVRLPRCRFRADVAAYGCDARGEQTVVFECKQSVADLRRDNSCSDRDRRRLETIRQRREVIERNLRVHFPALRRGEALFAEYDQYDFDVLNHASHGRVSRQIEALQTRVRTCTKFETLVRYRCANLYYLVLSEGLFREHELPFGWGALVERSGRLELASKPSWHETTAENCVRCLQRIAIAGTRALNRNLQITFDDVKEARCRIET